MNRNCVVSIFVLIILCANMWSQDSAKSVDKKGSSSTVKFEHLISGHLKDLNDKYKFRVTETTYQPGGYIGEHHHVGPGIRYVVSGELT